MPLQLPEPPDTVATPSLLAVPDYARSVAYQMYPGQPGQGDKHDAARHMLAAGTLARKYGPGVATFMGKMHEWSESPLYAIRYLFGGKMPKDYAPDLHNNALGVELARRAKHQADLERLVLEHAERAAPGMQPGRAVVEKAEGGEVSEDEAATLGPMRKTPEDIAERSPFYGYVRRRGNEPAFGGAGFMLGDRTLALDAALEGASGAPPTARATLSSNVGPLGLNATALKPTDAQRVMIGILNGSIPLGAGRAMLGMTSVNTPEFRGVTGRSVGYSRPLGPGHLFMNATRAPQGGPTRYQAGYNAEFARGGLAQMKECSCG